MGGYKSAIESDKAHARYGWLPLNQPPGEQRQLPVDQLLIDDAYQRGENTAEIRNISRDFNWAAFGSISVAEDPDGKLYVIDGQQRTAAARKRGIPDVPAMVHRLSREAPHRYAIARRASTGIEVAGHICAADALAALLAARRHGFGLSYGAIPINRQLPRAVRALALAKRIGS